MNRQRRDLRAEWLARQVASGPRPRFALRPLGSRPRSDKRAETAAITVPARRLRLDRAARGSVSAAPAQAPEPTPRPLVVAEPAFLVFAFAEAKTGRLSRHDRQVLGAARILAAGGGVLLLAPKLDEDAGAAGVDRLIGLEAAGYDPEGRATAITEAISAFSPRHVVFPESAEGGDIARRVAAALGEPLFAGTESLTAKLASRPARAGLVERRTTPPRLISLSPDSVSAYSGSPHEAQIVPFSSSPGPARGLLSAETLAIDPRTINLAEAGFVVAAGNGITDFAAFEELCLALGATPGASRVVCDAGKMPREYQIGASGTVLDAVCYIAFGISGAPQHLQGIGRVEHVLAVNTDLHAAIIARSELAVIADAQKVMPALIATLKARK